MLDASMFFKAVELVTDEALKLPAPVKVIVLAVAAVSSSTPLSFTVPRAF